MVTSTIASAFLVMSLALEAKTLALGVKSLALTPCL